MKTISFQTLLNKEKSLLLENFLKTARSNNFIHCEEISFNNYDLTRQSQFFNF